MLTKLTCWRSLPESGFFSPAYVCQLIVQNCSVACGDIGCKDSKATAQRRSALTRILISVVIHNRLGQLLTAIHKMCHLIISTYECRALVDVVVLYSCPYQLCWESNSCHLRTVSIFQGYLQVICYSIAPCFGLGFVPWGEQGLLT